MEILDYLNEEISKIESDNRFNYLKANVQVNAPLALIQVDLTARHRALKGVINFIGSSNDQIGLCLTYAMHLSVNYYRQNSEIKGFSYAALIDNIAKYPDDKTVVTQVDKALSDNKIVGYEYKAIFDRLLETHGVYYGAKMDSDHSNAKQELIEMIVELETL